MSDLPKDQILQMETTCGSLLYELQIIWDEVGESDAERDKLLLELEQECLEVYRRKVDRANRLRAQLRQAIADSEAELAAICSAMGERPVHLRQDQKRLQGQLIAEQEAIFGSKPSPSKPLSSKKPPRTSTGSANRRMSLGGALLQTPKFDPHSGKHGLVGIASRPNRKDDGVATLSADRRGLDVVGLPMKKHSFETEALIRKPLSQVTALSCKANTGNALEGLNISHNRPPAKAVVSNNMLATTPSKQTFVTNEENRNPEVTSSLMPTTPLRLSESTQTATTPVYSAVLFASSVEEIQPPLTPEEMPILVPPTPSTVSVPMQMSMTPASASIPFETGALKKPDETEYSFEERRAGFIVPMTHLKSVQV